MRDDVIVVGGGVVGASVAYHLARDGVAVRLLEREQLASESSGAAAGMLLPVGEAEGKDALLQFGSRSLAALPDLVDELLERVPELIGGAERVYHVLGRDPEVDAKLAATVNEMRLRSRTNAPPPSEVVAVLFEIVVFVSWTVAALKA